MKFAEILLLFIYALMVAFVFFRIRAEQDRWRHEPQMRWAYVMTTGMVLRNEQDNLLWHPVVHYTANGTDYIYREIDGDVYSRLCSGQKVAVFYEPYNPKRVFIPALRRSFCDKWDKLGLLCIFLAAMLTILRTHILLGG